MKKRKLVRIVVLLIIILSFSYVCLNYFKNSSFKRIYQNRQVIQQFILNEIETKHENIEYALISLADEDIKKCNNSFEINEAKLKERMNEVYNLFDFKGSIYFVSDVGKIIIPVNSTISDIENVLEYDWYKQNTNYYGIKIAVADENYLKEKRIVFLYPLLNYEEKYLGTLAFEYDVNEYESVLNKYNMNISPYGLKLEFDDGNVIFEKNMKTNEDYITNRYKLKNNIILKISYAKSQTLWFAKYVILIFNVVNAIVIIQLVYLTLIKNKIGKFKIMCYLSTFLILLELLFFNIGKIQDGIYHCKTYATNFQNYFDSVNEQRNIYYNILSKTIDEKNNPHILKDKNSDTINNIMTLKKNLNFNSYFFGEIDNNTFLCSMYPNFSNEITLKITDEFSDLLSINDDNNSNIKEVNFTNENNIERLIYKKYKVDDKEYVAGFYVVIKNPLTQFFNNNKKIIRECNIRHGKIKENLEIQLYNGEDDLTVIDKVKNKKDLANFMNDQTILFRAKINNEKKYILKFAPKNQESEIVVFDIEYLYYNNYIELFLICIVGGIFLSIKFNLDSFEKNDKTIDYDEEIKKDIQNLKNNSN